jgi:hypothetical protein
VAGDRWGTGIPLMAVSYLNLYIPDDYSAIDAAGYRTLELAELSLMGILDELTTELPDSSTRFLKSPYCANRILVYSFQYCIILGFSL